MNTREQILAATARLLQERGLAHATTREIAREAGCSEGALYKHFEHKEDLFLAAVQANLPEFVETLAERQPGTGVLEENLTEIALAALNYYDKVVPLASSFFADGELLARYRELLSRIGSGPQSIYARITAYLQAEQRLGRIAACREPFGAAALLLGGCFEYAFTRQFLGANPFQMTDREFVQGLVQTLCSGLLA